MIYKVKNHNCTTTGMQTGQKSAYGLRKATVEMNDLEEKALLFYKLAVVKDRKYRMRTFHCTFVGKEMVDSIVVSGLSGSRKEAVALGRTLNARYDLFENARSKTSSFEDGADKFYRFKPAGALRMINKISEMEIHEDEYSVPTTCTTSVGSSSDHERTGHGAVLQRQNGKRNVKSYKHWLETEISPNDTISEGSDEEELTNLSLGEDILTTNRVIEGENQSKEGMVERNIIPLKRQVSEGTFVFSVQPFNEAVELDEPDMPICVRSPLVRSPQDVRANLLREQSESSNIDSILRKESSNLLTMDKDDEWTIFIIGDEEDRKKYHQNQTQQKYPSDMSHTKNPNIKKEETSCIEGGDDQSTLTEFIIGIEEDRKKYRKNQIQQKHPSDMSYIKNPNIEKEETNCIEGGEDQSTLTDFIIGIEEDQKKYRKNQIQQKHRSYMSCIKNPSIEKEETSCIERDGVNTEINSDAETNFDDKIEVRPSTGTRSVSKNVEDNQRNMELGAFENSVESTYKEKNGDHLQREALLRTQNDTSLFHVSFTKNDSRSGADDDMTQITMDHALLSLSAKNTDDHFRPTSKTRIQKILWNDLYSSDFSVIKSAMEELETIVAREPERRKQIVRMGGVMAIIGTMEEYFEIEVIQYHCFVIVELLASMEPDACKALNEMKGIGTIVRSMENHVDSNRVQEAGRLALATVCRLHHPVVC